MTNGRGAGRRQLRVLFGVQSVRVFELLLLRWLLLRRQLLRLGVQL